MPRATVTSRALNNKATGIDIFVPTFHQTKEMLTSIVHYQVVVVSNLACFKSPSHKDSDVIQFSIDRKMNEFEDMRTKVAQLYCGTMLPPINKKSIIVNDMVLKERRSSMEHLMKCIASVPKLCTCVPILEFLGVDTLRAKKFNRGEPLTEKQQVTSASDSQSPLEENEGESESPDQLMFGEDEDSGNEDLFSDEMADDRTDGLFGTDDGSRAESFKVFSGQDLKRDLTEEDESEFAFIPDSIITKREVVSSKEEEEEDHSDLFKIEDDLDKLWNVRGEESTKKLKDSSNTSSRMTVSSSTTKSGNTSTAGADTSPSKLQTKPKPTLPSKPKPAIASKPSNLTTVSGKPSVPSKPKPSPSPKNESSKPAKPASLAPKTNSGETIGDLDSLGQEDIMKYLQDNLEDDNEVSLF